MFAIGLDVGTTGICGILMNSSTGSVECIANRKNDTWIDGEAWEKLQSPEQIVEKINEILDELYCDNIEAIGVTGQMHGILYYDTDGNAVSPLYIWQDGRGNLVHKDKTYAEELGSHSGYGNVTHYYNTVNGLVPKTAVGYCTIHDYVVMTLTGKKRAIVHSSDAASFGNYDLEGNTFIIKNSMQPEITDTSRVIGEWRGIPVSVAIGDNQASFLGGGCTDGTVLFNVGTGSQISVISDIKNAPHGLELRPLTDGRRILVGSSLCGGRAFAILESFFREVARMAGATKDRLYDEMTVELGDKKRSSLQFKTLFCGTRSEPERRAEISELSEDNFTPADMICSCLNGICDELFEMYKASGADCKGLVGTGNGIRKNKALKDIIEEKFNLKMLIPKFSEEAALGAVLFALVAIGRYKSIDEAERIVNYEGI